MEPTCTSPRARTSPRRCCCANHAKHQRAAAAAAAAARADAHQNPQDPVPKGWRQCPPMGAISPLHRLIPMKVPLGDRFADAVRGAEFTPSMALEMAFNLITASPTFQVLFWFFCFVFCTCLPLHAAAALLVPCAVLHQTNKKINNQTKQNNHMQEGDHIGLVLDLTNTDRYYAAAEFVQQGVAHVKVCVAVPCSAARGVWWWSWLFAACFIHSALPIPQSSSSIQSHHQPTTLTPSSKKQKKGAVPRARRVARRARRQPGGVGGPQGDGQLPAVLRAGALHARLQPHR